MSGQNELHRVDGTKIYVNSWLKPGQSFTIGGTVYMNLSDYWKLRGRPPLWTRHMLGVIEAERDQRRRAKRR